jgi:hypothetical protein
MHLVEQPVDGVDLGFVRHAGAAQRAEHVVRA